MAPYLPSDGRPDFERVVIRTADDQVAAELEAGDHMIIVAFQLLWKREESVGVYETEAGLFGLSWAGWYHGFPRVAHPPVGLYAMLSDVDGFPRAERSVGANALSTTIRHAVWYAWK